MNRIAEQLVPDDAVRQLERLVLPLVGDHEVEVAERQRGQRLLRLGFDHLAPQPGRSAGQRLDRRQDDAHQDRLEARHTRATGDRARGRGQVGLGARGPIEQRVRVADEHECGIRQPHAAAGGLALVVAGVGAGALEPLGTALALTAAVLYSAYILMSEGIARRLRPTVPAALVCTGAAVSLGLGSALLGELRPGDLTAAGWGWLAGLAVVSTVAAIGLFLAGLRRVRATTAAILSTLEPVVTVLLAFLAFGETLGAVQLLGGALVLGAVPVLRARLPRRAGAQPPVPMLAGAE